MTRLTPGIFFFLCNVVLFSISFPACSQMNLIVTGKRTLTQLLWMLESPCSLVKELFFVKLTPALGR